MFLLPFSDDNIRNFGARALSSRNQSVFQPGSAAKFNAAGARPTFVRCEPFWRDVSTQSLLHPARRPQFESSAKYAFQKPPIAVA